MIMMLHLKKENDKLEMKKKVKCACNTIDKVLFN